MAWSAGSGDTAGEPSLHRVEPWPVKPTTWHRGSVAAVTRASAAAASRQLSGVPDKGDPIEPDTSSPIRNRWPVGSTDRRERRAERGVQRGGDAYRSAATTPPRTPRPDRYTA